MARKQPRQRARAGFRRRHINAAGHINPRFGTYHIRRGRDTSHSGGRTSARAGGNSRREQDNRRCVDHATAAGSSRSGICRHACSGSRNAREGHQLDDFLDKNRIPHRLIEFESEQGQALSERFHLTTRDLPVLITSAGARLRKPSLREVAREAGLLRPLAEENETEVSCDLAIVGAGPAGLAAAVYAASEGLKTVVVESYAPGGQAGSSSFIENFFGFPTGIGGGELTWLAQLQAYRFGAKFSTPAQALSLQYHPDGEYRACLETKVAVRCSAQKPS